MSAYLPGSRVLDNDTGNAGTVVTNDRPNLVGFVAVRWDDTETETGWISYAHPSILTAIDEKGKA